MTNVTVLSKRQSLSGLVSHQPTIIADLIEPVEGVPAGTTVYLVRPDLTENAIIDAIGRQRGGRLRAIEVPWTALRNPRLEMVPVHIAEYCWRSTHNEMRACLQRIQQTHCPVLADFGVSIDLDTL